MISLTDYVGTDSRVGRKNNIWTSIIFWYKAGEGTFSDLSPNKITFSGNTTTLFVTNRFYLQVELLSETRCNVSFGKDRFTNVTYSIDGDTFVANLPANIILYLSRYNKVETEVTRTIATPGEYLSATWHIQPV